MCFMLNCIKNTKLKCKRSVFSSLTLILRLMMSLAAIILENMMSVKQKYIKIKAIINRQIFSNNDELIKLAFLLYVTIINIGFIILEIFHMVSNLTFSRRNYICWLKFFFLSKIFLLEIYSILFKSILNFFYYDLLNYNQFPKFLKNKRIFCFVIFLIFNLN